MAKIDCLCCACARPSARRCCKNVANRCIQWSVNRLWVIFPQTFFDRSPWQQLWDGSISWNFNQLVTKRVDGHEREDVITHCQNSLMRWNVSKGLAPSTTTSKWWESSNVHVHLQLKQNTRKRLVLIYHDGSTISTKEGQKWAWATGDKRVIQSQTKTAWIMITDLIEQHDSFLRFQAELAGLPSTARILPAYSAEKEG